MDGLGFSSLSTFKLFGVQRNLLQVMNNKYFQFIEVTEDYEKAMKKKNQKPKKVPGGSAVDVVDALWVDYSKEETKMGTIDKHDIKVENRNFTYVPKLVDEVQVIIPEGLRDVLSLDTTTKGRLTLSYRELYGDITYRTKVVAMVKKMTGFYFSAYQTVQLFTTILMTDE